MRPIYNFKDSEQSIYPNGGLYIALTLPVSKQPLREKGWGWGGRKPCPGRAWAQEFCTLNWLGLGKSRNCLLLTGIVLLLNPDKTVCFKGSCCLSPTFVNTRSKNMCLKRLVLRPVSKWCITILERWAA